LTESFGGFGVAAQAMENVSFRVKEQGCCSVDGRGGRSGVNLEGLFKHAGAEEIEDEVETKLAFAGYMA
jgi:hypothetical protein